MSAVSEDGLVILLDRLENRAIKAAKLSDLQVETRDMANEVRRPRADIKAAEAKIYEWAEYASQLRSAISAIDPRVIKRKTIVLPDMPKPLEVGIPF